MALWDYLSVPYIDETDLRNSEKYPNLYQLNDDLLSTNRFATTDWDGLPVVIPSVKDPRKFKYLLDGKKMIGVIRPATRDFLILTVNVKDGEPVILSNLIGPELVVRTPRNQILKIRYYEEPVQPIVDPPLINRLSQVSEIGIKAIEPNFLIILFILVVVLAGIVTLVDNLTPKSVNPIRYQITQ